MEKSKEIKTVTTMVQMYCHGKHKTKRGSLCDECSQLLSFVTTKRDKCPYGDNKDYCSVCKVHCYRSNPEMREKIRAVMRYAAPRMCFTHPILTASHLKSTIHSKREAKKQAKKAAKKND